ncbi:MAG: 5-formyltetrahydrofolate cyclo-ligase [Halioglobus sp.]
MQKPHQSKPELRQQLRLRRKAVPQRQRDLAAIGLAHNVTAIPGWEDASRVAIYFASDGEADPSLVAKALYLSKRAPYLPVIQQDKTLLFAPWEASGELRENHFGIPEPQTTACTAEALDIVLMPLVGWGVGGQRLGMGGGYYDRSLATAAHVIKVGVAFEMQRVDDLVTDPWDIRMDFIVTESALIECQGK